MASPSGSPQNLAPPKAAKKRDAGIDIFRGALTILVILGHFSELTQRESLLTWLGTGFRMPLFIGLSGYLYNLEKARATPAGIFAHKHYRRLVLPWMLACLVDAAATKTLSWLTPIDAVLRPPFHLWFVPVLLCFIVIARVCRLNRATLFAVSIPTSIAAMYVFGVGHEVHRVYPLLPDRRFFIFPIYFAYGLWVARAPAGLFRSPVSLGLAMIGMLWWIVLWNRPSANGEVAAELILCLPLISLLPWLRDTGLRLPLVAHLGRDSLFFYLWHPLAFGFWLWLGLHGWSMLAWSALTLLLSWRLIARWPLLAGLLGILPNAVSAAAPSAHPASDHAPIAAVR